MSGFLPISKEDMSAAGIGQLDFVYITGDAYVDHPSFGHAVISRVLQAHGYQTGIIAQPDWKDPDSVTILGRPRLGFLVTAGNMDSMVNHYSVSKKRRGTDAYTPGGEMGKRPDYACLWTNTDHYRRDRGFFTKTGPLRLLVGQSETFDSSGVRSRPS